MLHLWHVFLKPSHLFFTVEGIHMFIGELYNQLIFGNTGKQKSFIVSFIRHQPCTI